MTAEILKKAVLWDPAKDKKVQCYLCSWNCLISPNRTGHCNVRKNIDGTLYTLVYDRICAANADPIEKKPLFHFQPGTMSFSIATLGCNFRCDFCQNWQISQAAIEDLQIQGQKIKPEEIISLALNHRCKSIAYTYTEPTIFMELCNDCGMLAKEHGLKNVFVSNGYQTKKAIDFASKFLDGINVDLKAITEDYYMKHCKAKLQPVLDTISYIAKETDIWLEVTTLLLPGENDSDDQLRQSADFIVTQAGPDVPWHISRFYPQYKCLDSQSTPISSLERAMNIGKQAGLRYVYVGNVPGSKSESTFCYDCGKILIERVGYKIKANNIIKGKCPDCDAKIAGFEL